MGFDLVDDTQLEGLLTFRVEGPTACVRRLERESGGHRWQRVPPNEKRGRVHTSTVTVAVTRTELRTFELREADVRIWIARGTGKGGQHRNKRDTCVQLRHIPTGIEARVDGRNQHANRRAAWNMLAERVATHHASRQVAAGSAERRAMVGSGMRGDKIRTYRVRDNCVLDHRSGQKLRLDCVLGGALDG